MSIPDPPLLATKLYRPHPRARLVKRPRLHALFTAAPLPPLTLVVAPAGFGKTTLLVDWLDEVDTPAAWLALDVGDNDPGAFLRYLIAALQTVLPAVGADTLLLLNTQPSPPPKTLVVNLINDLAAVDTPTILILDDYHLVTNPVVHQTLLFLLERRPSCLHLVLSSRTDPPLPLARLRARAQLREVRAADLRFTPEEAAAFLHDVMGMQVSDDDAHTIEQRTEGWAAALQLAGLALRRRGGQAELIQAFAGSNRYIVDYLVEEVIEQMPPHLRAFVLQTSVLDRMSAALCDALLDLTPTEAPTSAGGARAATMGDSRAASRDEFYSQIVLAQLDQANLFVVPLDDERHWYRYHHLFGEVLRERLRRGTSQEVVAGLRRRASQWFAQQGLVHEAIRYALEAEDWLLAASMLERFAFRVGLRGEAVTVLGWLQTIPEPVLRARPFLCVMYFSMLSLTQQHGAEAWLDAAERAPRAGLPPTVVRQLEGYITLSHTYLALKRGDRARVIALAQQALGLFAEADELGHDSALTYLTGSYHLSGDVGAASEHQLVTFLEKIRGLDYVITRVASTINLAYLHQLQGRLHTAAATLRRVFQIVEPQVLPNIVYGAYYDICQGELLREWDRLDEAQHHLSQAIAPIKSGQRAEAEYMLRAYVGLARLQQAQGDGAAALTTLREFINLAKQRGFFYLIGAQAAAVQAHVYLLLGNLVAAQVWAARSGIRPDDPELPFPREAEYLTLARVLVAQAQLSGRTEEVGPAIGLLTRLLADADAKGRNDSAIKIRLVRVLAYQAQGDTAGALADLHHTLRLAEPEGYVRSFVDEGASLYGLLADIRARLPEPALRDYTTRLLASFPAIPGQVHTLPEPAAAEPPLPSARQPAQPQHPLVEPLTARERQVLQLLATGLTNKAIARQLRMSNHTVNSHLKTIYGKLGVTTRAAATRAALEAGLDSALF